MSNSSSSLSDWSKIRNEAVPTSPALLYGIVSGYYLQGIYVSLYIEERRKDTIVMVIHHFVTLFLVSFSFGMRLWKIGILVLFCHDFWKRFNLTPKFYIRVASVFGQFYSSPKNRKRKNLGTYNIRSVPCYKIESLCKSLITCK